jgi:hypothetical protein
MAEVIQDAPQEFWHSPLVLAPVVEASSPVASPNVADACADCGTEFMIGARFCHACGFKRPQLKQESANDATALAGVWYLGVTRMRSGFASVAALWRSVTFPVWLRYLHFHEIKRWVGLPTGSLVAFMIGLGCVLGAIGVSLFYKASNLAEFQAIQMWRIEWLLAATASFVAGILLKPADTDHD